MLPPGPPGNGSTLLWGYEANFGLSRILSYDIATGAQGATCVPDPAAGGPDGNGRGVAFDPLDGNLWTTRLTFFTGDGLIHKVTPPNETPGTCVQVDVIPFGDGPGGTVQDDIGALDVDQGSRHIWAAGYFPISVLLGPARNYFYLVNRNNGKIIQSCWTLANPEPEDQFNDSLTYARLKGLPGSGQYLLTDGGEFFGTPLKVIDTSTCHNGREATIVANFPTDHGITGLDFEAPGLINTDLHNLYNNGDKPFTTSTFIGSTNAPFGLEDVSLCAFRAKFGGDGNDMCPY
jgi:DNA-binding beta-propeller fold protein YncE